MSWKDELFDRLAAAAVGGYHVGAIEGAEPTALAGMALARADRMNAAIQSAEFLAKLQLQDGSVPVQPGTTWPGWPTALAILAWRAVDPKRYFNRTFNGKQWLLSVVGKPVPPSDEVGHDVSLIAWPWAEDTHSWLEPTTFSVLALRALGESEHERTMEGIKVMLDRLLPDGGCNYGNTIVLGQFLRPHVHPSGIVATGLAKQFDHTGRLGRMLDYLEAEGMVKANNTLCWALIGLSAHGRRPENADELLEASYKRVIAKDPSTQRLALLACAVQGTQSALVTLP
jgi:hypothetical protein